MTTRLQPTVCIGVLAIIPVHERQAPKAGKMPRQAGVSRGDLQEIIRIDIDLQTHPGRHAGRRNPPIYNRLYINVFFTLDQSTCPIAPAQECQRGHIRPENADLPKKIAI